MEETKRIIHLFEKLYDGSPWIDINLHDTLMQVSAKDAATHLLDTCNSIWEIVNHLIAWRRNVLQRLQGSTITTPAHNYFEKVPDISDAAWVATLQDLADSQKQWIAFLKNFKENAFSTIYPNNDMNYYEHIHGIIQHDAYHLGQISLLKKFIKNA